MSNITGILLKHRIFESLVPAFIGSLLYEAGLLIFNSPLTIPSWLLLIMWFGILYLFHSGTQAYYIQTAYAQTVREILYAEGFSLTREEPNEQLYLKPRKLKRIHSARLSDKSTYFVLEISESYENRLGTLIPDQILYGKR